MTGSATGRTVLVTGGSRGIGAAIAKKLASIGMNVVVNYASREDDAAQITKEVAAINGGGAIAAKGDVSRSDESATSARMRWSATATAWPPQAGRTSSSAPATRRTRWPTQSGGFGRVVLMGAEAKPLAVSPFDLLMRRIKIIGSQQNGREYLHEALAIAASGKVRVVTETYRLDEIGKAYERVEKGQVRFRAVVTM